MTLAGSHAAVSAKADPSALLEARNLSDILALLEEALLLEDVLELVEGQFDASLG